MNLPVRAAFRPTAASIRAPRSGLLIAWQLVAVAVVATIILHGPARWALCAVALVGAALTTVRWHHRWAYEWVRPGWEFCRASRQRHRPIAVAAVRIRGGSRAALLHDGSGFAVVLSVEPPASATEPVGLPVDALVELLEPGDPVVSAVQLVMHVDCLPSAADRAVTDRAAAASSGRRRQEAVPRSQTTWVVLRHDPMASGYAVSAVGAPPDVCASLARTLGARGQRAGQSLSSRGLRAALLTADAARDVLDEALVSGAAWAREDGDAADASRTAGNGPGRRWSCWDHHAARHIAYQLHPWPSAGLAALQRELATVPGYSVTTAVTVTRAPDGRPTTTGMVRVAADPQLAPSGLDQHVRRAAVAGGAGLVPLHGEHAAGVLATLPLGREPGRPDRRRSNRRGTAPAVLADTIPVTAGGLVIGAEDGGAPVTVPLFRAGRGTQVCVAGHPALSRLLVLRALSAGARVQVVTTRSDEWLRLRDRAGARTADMTVVPPGSPPPATGSRVAPWLVIDDTGAPAGRRGAWQSDVAAAASVPMVPGALHGLDAMLLERVGPVEEAAIAVAFGLAGPARKVAGAVPAGCVAVVVPGAIRVARLLLDQRERSALTDSVARSGQTFNRRATGENR